MVIVLYSYILPTWVGELPWTTDYNLTLKQMSSFLCQLFFVLFQLSLLHLDAPNPLSQCSESEKNQSFVETVSCL